jgi:hypothetical protein
MKTCGDCKHLRVPKTDGATSGECLVPIPIWALYAMSMYGFPSFRWQGDQSAENCACFEAREKGQGE